LANGRAEIHEFLKNRSVYGFTGSSLQRETACLEGNQLLKRPSHRESSVMPTVRQILVFVA